MNVFGTRFMLLFAMVLFVASCGDDDNGDGGDVAVDANSDAPDVDAEADSGRLGDADASTDAERDAAPSDADLSDADPTDADPTDADPTDATPDVTVPDAEVPSDLMENLAASGVLDEREGVFAFPGATGHGRRSTGGRGGRVVCVNTLEDINVDGDGLISYREAIQGENEADFVPRIVTFCVSGVIHTGVDRVLNTTGHLTVACQTAPSPGVVLTGYRPVDLDNDADHQVWRHCDIKPRDTLNAGLNTGQRNVTIGGGRGVAPDHLMFDHMSLMYSTDDSFVVFVNSNTATSVPSNITLSHSIIGDGDTTCHRSDDECGNPASGARGDYVWPNHSMGPSFSSDNGTPVRGVSVIANLIGNTNARNPQIRGVSPGEIANNFLFNIHSRGVQIISAPGGAPNDVYVEGNTIKEGPDDRGTDHINAIGRVVVASNTRVSNEGVVTSTDYLGNDTTELPMPRAYTTGDSAFRVSCVGASRPLRDSEDARMVAELGGTGTDPVLASAEVGIGPRIPPIIPPCRPGAFCFYEPTVDDQGQRDYRTYDAENRHPRDYDEDGDGIADSWERQVIASDADDALDDLGDIDHTTDSDDDGYLDIEEWLNLLARCPAT